jgi:hypothetical protein
MPKPVRSMDNIVQTISQSLAEAAAQGSTFCAACWNDDDSDAGYLVHVDGRMVGFAGYQYGFDNISELLSTELTDEVKRYARSEAGHLAGGLEPVDLCAANNGSDDWGLLERLPYVFGPDTGLVYKAVKANKASVSELFELIFAAPGKMVRDGGCVSEHDKRLVKVNEDVSWCRLSQSNDGELSWNNHVIAKAGETLSAFVGRDNYAAISVLGGYVYLHPNGFEISTPSPETPRSPGP